MSFRVRRQLKSRMEQAVAVSGRSMMQEIEIALESHYDQQQRMEGPRSQHFFAALAEIAKTAFPDESWFSDPDVWAVVRNSLVGAIDARAPPSRTLLERIAAAGRLADRLFTTTDRDEREKLRVVASNLARDERLPLGVRDSLWIAGMLNEPIVAAPEPISLDAQIEAGRRFVRELQTTNDPARRQHCLYMLSHLSRVEGFPAEVRAEFARHAAATPVAPQSVQPAPVSAPPPGNDQKRAAARLLLPELPDTDPNAEDVRYFNEAWKLATKFAIDKVVEPAVEDIARVIAGDEQLLFIAGLKPTMSPAAVLRHRAMLAWVKEHSIVPPEREEAATEPNETPATAKFQAE
jgi:hypothetical protein